MKKVFSRRYKMTSETFAHRLVLPSVRPSDSGEYAAVAGSSVSKGNLTVEGRDIKISEPAAKNVTVSPPGSPLLCPRGVKTDKSKCTANVPSGA